MDWWALSNISSIMWICSAIHGILADEAFTATDSLISQSFVIAFVYPAYMWIAHIWGFPAQLSLWQSVHWLWRYKLNDICDTKSNGKDAIVVIVDRFTKMVRLKATMTNVSSEEITKVYWNKIWILHTVSRKIQYQEKS